MTKKVGIVQKPHKRMKQRSGLTLLELDLSVKRLFCVLSMWGGEPRERERFERKKKKSTSRSPLVYNLAYETEKKKNVAPWDAVTDNRPNCLIKSCLISLCCQQSSCLKGRGETQMKKRLTASNHSPWFIIKYQKEWRWERNHFLSNVHINLIFLSLSFSPLSYSRV